MKKIDRSNYVMYMSANNPPVAHVKSGDMISFEVYDGFTNNIRHENQYFSSLGWHQITPVTGPLYIDDAEKGDILKVSILSIIIDTQGVMITVPGKGRLGHFFEEEKTKIIPIKDGIVLFNNKIQIPIKPMIGVIGTAPETGEVRAGIPGKHGGNMDCNRIIEGAMVYLPVNVPGALLYMGDLHAIQGDGEVVMCGVEICGEVIVKVELLKQCNLPLPLVVQAGDVMTIGSGKTFDEASRIAIDNMFFFVHDALKLESNEIGMLFSAIGNLRICQIVNQLITVRMELPLWVLETYGYKMK